MKAAITEQPTRLLAGFDFFGDPFRSHGGWSADNEIGRLWQRWGEYWYSVGMGELPIKDPTACYEFHIYHPETLQTGEFEIFVGVEVTQLADLPLAVVGKTLPGGRYAVFTLAGEEIASDWIWELDHAWLPKLGVQRLTTFSVQRYDERFKSVENLSESELEVYIPLLP